MKKQGNARHHRSFTLIELLVVIAIMALLMAIIVPTVGKARESARKMLCGTNLRSIGQAIQAYLGENHSFYPPMAPMPKIEAVSNPLNPRPAMSEILSPHVSGQTEVFRCPSDSIRDADMASGAEPETVYYKWQGTSYEPRPGLSVVSTEGYWMLSQENRALWQSEIGELSELIDNAARIELVREFEAFHGETNDDDMNWQVLFADFHVDALATMDQP